MIPDIVIWEAWAMPLTEPADKKDPRIIIRVVWTTGELKGDLLTRSRLRAKKNMAQWWMPVDKFERLCKTYTQRELALLAAVRMFNRVKQPPPNPFLPKQKP